MLEYLGNAVVLGELLGIYPDALTHQERVVPYMLAALYPEPRQELVNDKIHHFVKGSVELVDVAVSLDGKAREVDGGEAEIASAGDYLAARVVNVADNSGAAAHVSGFGVVVAGLVVLEVERSVDEREVREHALCGNADSKLEKVVVGVAGVVVDALFDLENMYREDRSFTVAQTVFLGEHYVLDNHSALRGGVGAVVYRGERILRAGAGIHRVQVVNERFHCLVGRAVGLGFGELFSSVLEVRELVAVLRGRDLPFLRLVFVVVLEAGVQSVFLGDIACDELEFLKHLGVILNAEGKAYRLRKVGGVQPAEGLFNALRHGVVEYRHGLTAVLVVLVRLNGNARKRRVAGNIVRLAEVSVAGGKTAVEQLEQVDLAAGGGERQEVEVVYVDIAVDVRLGVLRVEHVHLVELLGTFAAVFQHGTHCGVAVDVGVFALDVAVRRGHEGQILVYLHQGGVHLARPGAVCAVQYVSLGGLCVTLLDEHPFYHILYFLNGGIPAYNLF